MVLVISLFLTNCHPISQISTYSLMGTIYDENNKPWPYLDVRAYDKDMRTQELLGEAKTNSEGHYQINYTYDNFSNLEINSADLFIKVFVKKSQMNEEIGRTPIYFNIPQRFNFDFKISESTEDYLSEFERITNELNSLLGNLESLADLKENENQKDISFLSEETGASVEIISLLQTSFKFSEECDSLIPPDIFFGLFYMQFPSDCDELLLISNDSLIKGINDAIKINIISSKWLDQIPDFF